MSERIVVGMGARRTWWWTRPVTSLLLAAGFTVVVLDLGSGRWAIGFLGLVLGATIGATIRDHHLVWMSEDMRTQEEHVP